MPYRPTYGLFFKPAGPIIGAIPAASFGAAVIGSSLLLFYLVTSYLIALATGADSLSEPHLIPVALVVLGLGMAMVIVATTFLVGFYLMIFGLPVAALMRSRLAGPIGLAVSLTIAIFAALVFMGLFSFHPKRLQNHDLEFLALVLAYAIPAGLLYRRAVLSLLDELD